MWNVSFSCSKGSEVTLSYSCLPLPCSPHPAPSSETLLGQRIGRGVWGVGGGFSTGNWLYTSSCSCLK